MERTPRVAGQGPPVSEPLLEEGQGTPGQQHRRNPSLSIGEEMKQDDDFRRISRLHGAASLFFIIQTAAYVAAYPSVSVEPTTGFPVITGGPIGDPSIQTYPRAAFNPCILIILFVALAALDHTITALMSWLKPQLVRHFLFVAESNPLRWLEYSISASLMLIAISTLAGVHDIHLWLTMALLNASGMLTGLALEMLPKANRYNHQALAEAPDVTRLVFFIGCLAIASPWIVIFCYFLNAGSPPDFVYAAFFGTFILFMTFAGNSYLHHIHGAYSFPTTEIVYVCLSFTAKTFLAADVFGGIKAASN